MSKNFELMQQIENDRRPAPDQAEESAINARAKAPARSSQQPRWAEAEAMRLVQQLFLSSSHEPPHVVVLSGIDHGNGCSHMCASVALALAKATHRPVCLVEGDFHRPSLAGMFGVSNRVGLTDALTKEEPLSSLVQTVGQEHLWLLTSGPLSSHSSHLLHSVQLRERIAQLRKEFDFVIIDAPPVSRYWDAVAFGQLSDGLVLVLEANSTHRETASSAAEKVHAAHVPILAAVLNKRTFPIPDAIFKRI